MKEQDFARLEKITCKAHDALAEVADILLETSAENIIQDDILYMAVLALLDQFDDIEERIVHDFGHLKEGGKNES